MNPDPVQDHINYPPMQDNIDYAEFIIESQKIFAQMGAVKVPYKIKDKEAGL